MSVVTMRRTCPHCRELRLFQRPGTTHIAHFILSILTVGIWIPIWILVGVLNCLNPYKCMMCGRSKWL